MLRIHELSVEYSPPRPGNWLVRFLYGPRNREHREEDSRDTPKSGFVLKNLDLEVHQGELLVVLGRSGAGKTTLLRSISGLLRVATGDIYIHGICQNSLPPHKRDVAYVFQNGGWYDHLTVKQHFQIAKNSMRANVVSTDWLSRVGLGDYSNQLPRSLSGGQLQRLAIGRAIAREKSLLLMDEPLSQLDGPARDEIRFLIQKLHTEGKTIVYVTHDQQDAFMLATKVAVLEDGKIQQIDLPSTIYNSPKHMSVAKAIGSPPMDFLQPEEILPAADLDDKILEIFPPSSVLGIRPRDWRFALRENTEIPSVESGKASVSQNNPGETMSSQRLVLQGQWVSGTFYEGQLLGRVKIGRIEISVLVDDRASILKIEPGQECTLSIGIDKIHPFDRQSGNRIRVNE